MSTCAPMSAVARGASLRRRWGRDGPPVYAERPDRLGLSGGG